MGGCVPRDRVKSQHRATPAARWIAGLSVLSLLCAGYLLLVPGNAEPAAPRGHADGYSRSAIGHRGLLLVLDHAGFDARRSRSARPVPAGLLVFAEPSLDRPDDVDEQVRVLDGRCAAADETLLVLPKRVVERRAASSEFALETGLVPEALLGDLSWLPLQPVLEVERFDAVGYWAGAGMPEPDLLAPVQLMHRSESLTPMLYCPEGVLLGYYDDGEDEGWVLSDPDLISNHGLARGRNAELLVEILSQIKGTGAILVDETMHGYEVEQSLFQFLGRYPGSLLTAQLLLLMALIAFTARGRFGPVVPPPSVLEDGKAFLIDNIVALRRRAGHHRLAATSYARMSLRRAAARLGVTGVSTEPELFAALARRSRDDEATAELKALLASRELAATERDVVVEARRIQALIQRMFDGS